MSERTIRDWLILFGGFHFFMAVLSLIASAAVFVYGVLPPIDDQGPGMAQALFVPVVGVIVGLIVSGVYILVGFGVMQMRNTARMISIFLAAFAIFGGFIAVIGSIASRIIGNIHPDLLSVMTTSAAVICFYSLISFMNIFLLIFFFLPQVRLAYYGVDLQNQSAGLPNQSAGLPNPQTDLGEQQQDDLQSGQSYADAG